MTAILIGAGSIGMRHLRNLQAIRPGDPVIICEPDYSRASGAMSECHGSAVAFESLRDALTESKAGDYAIIASPDDLHASHALELSSLGIPCYIEKPMVDPSISYDVTGSLYLSHDPNIRHAVGYQYRFQPTIIEHYERWQACGYLRFYARDDLEWRYGPRCLSVMAAHPIDTALYVFGPADKVQLKTDGLRVWGRIWHKGGAMSLYDISMEYGPRVSQIVSMDDNGIERTYDLPSDNQMYIDCLKAWLDWVDGGERDKRTATLAEGWQSIEVMRQVKHI